jgi:hypothetical protein
MNSSVHGGRETTGRSEEQWRGTTEPEHGMPGKNDGREKPPNSGGLKRENNDLQEVVRWNRGILRFRQKMAQTGP